MKKVSDVRALNDKALLHYASVVIGERKIGGEKDLRHKEPALSRELSIRNLREKVLCEGPCL